MQDRKATIAGLAAIGLWAIAAICFAIAAGLGTFIGWQNGTLGELRAIPWKVIAFGTAGLFGYHALYFSALRLAPPAEAGLIAYLWPLLIVLFSGLLPGVRLRAAHVIGALAGFAGAALLVADKLGGFAGTALPGYGLALLCAFTWAGYSVLSRPLGAGVLLVGSRHETGRHTVSGRRQLRRPPDFNGNPRDRRHGRAELAPRRGCAADHRRRPFRGARRAFMFPAEFLKVRTQGHSCSSCAEYPTSGVHHKSADLSRVKAGDGCHFPLSGKIRMDRAARHGPHEAPREAGGCSFPHLAHGLLLRA